MTSTPEPLLAWIEQTWARMEQENPSQTINGIGPRTNGMAPMSDQPVQGDLFEEAG